MGRKKLGYAIKDDDLESVKQKIKEYHQSKEVIHLSYRYKQTIFIKDPIVIESVYPMFFVVQPLEGVDEETVPVTYTDVACKMARILEYEPPFVNNIIIESDDEDDEYDEEDLEEYGEDLLGEYEEDENYGVD